MIAGYGVEPFGDTFMTAELAESWFRSRDCPTCEGELDTVASRSPSQHWLCAACGRCWAMVHGHLHGVDALSCKGCATRTKAECISRFGTRFPAFTGGGLPHEAT
jgi:hypothetical protein